MQFYLIAPLIFLLGRRIGAKRIGFFAAVTATLAGLGLLYPLLNRNLGEAKYHFEFAVWPMMLGFFCESIKNRFAGIKDVIARRTVGIAVVALPISVGLTLFGVETKLLVIGVGTFLLLPCFLAYFYGLACPGWIGGVFAWMGERTYSIYLWQQPLTICNFWSSAWHPIGSLIAVGLGALWFRIFEVPFLSKNRQKAVIK
jgi:peptidoglycan/LPS O-acetylase OafA/YrhL